MARSEPAKFLNIYYHCGVYWSDTWSCKVDDECPKCSADISPSTSTELCLVCGSSVEGCTDGKCSVCRTPIKDYDELQKELTDAPVVKLADTPDLKSGA